MEAFPEKYWIYNQFLVSWNKMALESLEKLTFTSKYIHIILFNFSSSSPTNLFNEIHKY